MIPEGKYRIPIIERSANSDKQRLMVGCPMTGNLRAEWVMARYGQCIPTNWSSAEFGRLIDQYSPLRFTVADARNLIATNAVDRDVEWLWFIDHDVVLPPLATVMLNEYMINKKYPIVSGLYFTKGVPSEPLIYRGYGTGYFPNWKMGDVVEVDGHGMGCTLIHCSILKEVYKDTEVYDLEGMKVHRIFSTPTRVFYDPQQNSFTLASGTEDLDFLKRVIDHGYLKRAGWPKHQSKRYPFIVDTNIYCRHIAENGIMYPSMGEEQKFLKQEKKSMPYFQSREIKIAGPAKLRELLVKYVGNNGKIGSQKEAKRLIRQGGISIDGIGAISDIEYMIERTSRVRIGRRRVYDFVLG